MSDADYVWLNDLSRQFLGSDYLLEGQTVHDRVSVIAAEVERRIPISGIGARVIRGIQRGWFSLSSPIWANFGIPRGMPISCFGSFLEDTTASILSTHAEVGMMSKYGGGTSGYFGELRGRGSIILDNGLSSGAVHFMQMFQTLTNVISQGGVRRGHFASWLPITHGDIEEFLAIKSEGAIIQDISFGVTITDAWMEEMISGDLDKRRIWAKVLQARANVGYPYIMFIDSVNRDTSDVYQNKRMKIYASNMCSEIFLPSSPTESFVCDLLSMNAATYEEWVGTDAVETAVCILDAVMSEFIEKAGNIAFMERAVKFARRHRALGVGVMGWHTLLQNRMIPFESMEAKFLNVELFKGVREKTYAASARLAGLLGEPELLEGYGRRNTTLMAVAPTKSSSFILGQVSQGIEPYRTNYDVMDRAKGKYLIKNRQLEALLEEKGRNTSDVWEKILKDFGSVRSLDCLSDHEKDVFKTYAEISQKEVVIQAAQRQKFIDQGQSLNIMVHPSVPLKDVNALYIEAWRMGVKSLYYQYSVNAAQELSNNLLACASCEA